MSVYRDRKGPIIFLDKHVVHKGAKSLLYNGVFQNQYVIVKRVRHRKRFFAFEFLYLKFFLKLVKSLGSTSIASKYRKSLTTVLSRNEVWKELAVLTKLDHPNIIKVLDFAYTRTFLFIVQRRYADDIGYILSDFNIHLERNNELLQTILFFMAPVFDAVRYLHSLQLVHCDIHAGNIVVCPITLSPVLIDFDTIRSESELITLNRLVVSQYFAAPDLFREKELSRKIDIYSLGAVCLYLYHWEFNTNYSFETGHLCTQNFLVLEKEDEKHFLFQIFLLTSGFPNKAEEIFSIFVSKLVRLFPEDRLEVSDVFSIDFMKRYLELWRSNALQHERELEKRKIIDLMNDGMYDVGKNILWRYEA